MPGYTFPQLFGAAPEMPEAAPAAPMSAADVWGEELARLNKRIEELRAQKSRFTPEELQQRRDSNEREYTMGMLGMLSGNEALQNAGGAIFKNALAMRQPKITERGYTDQITGEFTYDPGYLADQAENRASVFTQARAAALQHSEDTKARLAELERVAGLRYNQPFGVNMHVIPGVVDGPSGLPIGQDNQGRMGKLNPNGGWIPLGGGQGAPMQPQPQQGAAPTPMQPQASPAAGMQTPPTQTAPMPGQPGQPGQPAQTGIIAKPSSASASEDERKAAQWLTGAEYGYANMKRLLDKNPNAGQVPLWEAALDDGSPRAKKLVNSFRGADRQQFVTSTTYLKDALLRAMTGAGYNMTEATDAANMIAPEYGEHAETTKLKMAYIPVFLKGLRARAGRAAQAPLAELLPAAGAFLPGQPGAAPQQGTPAEIDFHTLFPGS